MCHFAVCRNALRCQVTQANVHTVVLWAYRFFIFICFVISFKYPEKKIEIYIIDN